jgi:mycobactin phenyloxazoline synthetase
MTSQVEALLHELDDRQVQLFAEDGHLRYRAPPRALSAEVRRRIVAHREALLAHLAAAPAPERLPERRRLPLTELQRAYWLAEYEVDGGTAGYWYEEYEADGFDPDRFRRAWARLIERHDALRMVVVDGYQEILREVPAHPIEHDDLRTATDEVATVRRAEARVRARRPRHPAERWPLVDISTEQSRHGWRVRVGGRFLSLDGVSWDALCQELAVLYADPDAALPDLQQSYGGAVLGDVERESGGDTLALAWWLDRDLPEPPDLPLRCGFDPTRPRRFRRKSLRLSADEFMRLRDGCARAKVTPNAALLASYGSVLAAWSAAPRFCLNLLISNPRHMQAGHWPLSNGATTLLLEVDGRDELAFAALASRLQSRLAEDMSRGGGVSGVAVTRKRARRRGLPARPNPFVFASILGMETDGAGCYGLERLGWRPIENYLQTPHILLDQQVFGRPDGLVLNWDYVAEAFDDGLVDAMFDALSGRLKALVADESAWTAPADVPLPGPQAATRLAANATAVATEPGRLHDFLYTRRDCDEPAVVDREHRWTHAELARRAGGIAHRIADSHGGRPVAILASRGASQVAAALGVLASGAPYVPLDPETPPLRLEAILRQVEPRVVLVDRVHASGGPAGWLVLEDLGEGAPPDLGARPTDPAYVIFTSGSTGTPKGVTVAHDAARNTIDDLLRRWPLRPRDAAFGLASFGFDLSVYDIFGVLSAGARLVIPDEASRRDPGQWVEWIAREGVTVWNSVPAQMQMLVDYAEVQNLELPLRLALLSGDWIPKGLPARVRERAPGCAVIALGGATEASIWSNYFDTRQPYDGWPSVPYGRPLANQTMHVLGARFRDRPDHCEGDLFIGGRGLAIGYFGLDDETRAGFITDPRTGLRLYRTGDRARYWPDGKIEFLGRRDTQVKIAGHRIELGEVEKALEAFPGVRCAVALVVETGGSRRLAACLLCDDRARWDEEALERFVRGRLLSYMVPRPIVRVERLPVTANGKVDRGALASLVRDEAGVQPSPDSGPRDELERLVHRAWAEALERDDFGCDHAFFAVGGDSVAVVRMLSVVERTTKSARLPTSAVLADTTVRSLAEILRRGGPSGPASLVHRFSARREGPLVFCLPPIGGTTFCYRALGKCLEGTHDVAAVSAVGVLAPEPDRSVEAMLDRYVPIFEAERRHGRTALLVGWSFGGVLALALKDRCQGRGLPLPVLVVDPWVRAEPVAAPLQDAVVRAEFASRVSALRASEPDFASPEVERLYRVYAANSGALFGYSPPRRELECTVVVASRTPGFTGLVPLLSSREWRLRPAIATIDADHDGVMEGTAIARVASIAAKLLEKHR